MSAVVVKIANLDYSEVVDISSICLARKASVRHNHTRSFTAEVPSGHALVATTMGDGVAVLHKGDRQLLVWLDGTIIHRGRVFGVERTGDSTTNRTVITSFDPLMELGYDSEDRAGRPVRDATGNFVDPAFTPFGGGSPGDPISGGDLLYQILTNSQVVGDEGGPGGEGPLPIDLTTGTFHKALPPATDLGPTDTMGWPMMIGDFAQMLVATNVMDIYLRPVDPVEGLPAYKMVALSAVNKYGTDRSATVHFDFWAGSKNATKCRHVEDFATICNKLYDYLGPAQVTGILGLTHHGWKANITPSGYPDGAGGSPWGADVTVPVAASRVRYGGQFMEIRIIDSTLASGALRPLHVSNWKAEQLLRVEPRDMLFITPSPDHFGLFEPYTDFNVGDLISINTGVEFGVVLTGAVERVYGWDVEWDRQGVMRVTDLLTSADAIA